MNKKLRTKWTREAAQDLLSMHNIDADDLIRCTKCLYKDCEEMTDSWGNGCEKFVEDSPLRRVAMRYKENE